jgi:putative two-component system response regulator
VLVVDDAPENLAVMSELLRGDYRVLVATSGERALALAASSPPDLIVLDVMMPGLDGYEVCRRLKDSAATAHIPIIFLTSIDDEDSERTGFELGAVDFVGKPVRAAVFLARVRTHVQLKQAGDSLRLHAHHLAQLVDERTREVGTIQDVTIFALASLAETRDNETGNHIRRTQHYVRALALALRSHRRFRAALGDEEIEMLFKSAPLHDIGKVGVPDHILLKPGKLTPEEFELMKQHAVFGSDAIRRAEALIGAEQSFLRFAREIAVGHHEKWDGSGYPQGLSGDDIPLSARLMAVADVYDALISKRVYKPAFPHEKAVQILVDGRGTHFDPDILDGFLGIAEEFRGIHETYRDD